MMRMGTFDFWQRWLVASCFVFAGVGILVATLNTLPAFDVWNAGVDEVFGQAGAIGPEAERVKTFVLGPLG